MHARVRLSLPVAALAVTAAGLVGCGGPSPEPAARAYLVAWAAGHLDAAAARTDDAAAARAALTASHDGLDVRAMHATLGDVSTDGERATAAFTAAVDVGGLGTWRYAGRLALVRNGSDWQVHWTPTDVHPALTTTTHLERIRKLPPRATIRGGDGRSLFRPTEVVNVGIEKSRLHGHAATTIPRVTAAVGVHDVAAVRKAVRAAGAHDFVPVITLRRPAYDGVKQKIYDLPGTVFTTDTVLLPPTPGFARALLGSVGPATADVLKAAGPEYAAGDSLGIGGLQQRFQARLAGRAGGRIVVANEIGVAQRTLHTFAPQRGQPVSTTLDARVQQAGEDALADEDKPAALVAVEASTGRVLAVVNTPDASSYDRALSGRYPPGSTFKVVSSYALLADGVTPSTSISCPPEVTVEGRTFRNFEAEALGPAPFRVDFAKSCNTAFIGAGDRLAPKQLTGAADALGLGWKWTLPLDAFSGSVPSPASAVEQAATMIGQGRVEVSPLAMAMVAAAVDSGRAQAPTLVTEPAQSAPAQQPQRLDPQIRHTLGSLMRDVVATGTAAGAGLPSGTAGKTGTAEFGAANPPQTHAWFIGYRGDIAFAVLVEGGGVGGRVAAPIAASFLSRL